ncbi:Glutamate receptor ionotropic, delta-1, partial [Clonorchis sinensis]
DESYDPTQYDVISGLARFQHAIEANQDIHDKSKVSYNLSVVVRQFSHDLICTLFADGFRVIISLTNCETARYIEMLTNRHHVLHLAIPKPFCEDVGYNPPVDEDTPFATIWMQPRTKQAADVIYTLAQMDYALRAYVFSDTTSGLLDHLLHRSTQVTLAREFPSPIFSPLAYDIDREQHKRQGMVILDKVLSHLASENESRASSHAFLLTTATSVEVELEKIANHSKLMTEYFWILGERLDMSVSVLLRILSATEERSMMNFGFLRYTPFLNPEDCAEFGFLLPWINVTFTKEIGCNFLDIPDRASAIIQSVLVLYRIYLEYMRVVENPQVVQCDVRPYPVYAHGSMFRSNFLLGMNIRVWETVTFYSLEKLPNRPARFRATARINGSATRALTQFGKFLKHRTMGSGLFANRFWSFHGRMLKLGTVIEDPMVMCNEIREDGMLVNASGMIVDLLDILKERFDFRYEIYSSSDGMYGDMINDIHWNGLIGDLLNKKFDFAAAAITVTKSRSKVVQYLGPFMEEKTSILMVIPTSPWGLFRMLQPFKLDVWLLLATCVILVGCLLYYMNRRSPLSAHNQGSQMERTNDGEVSFSENLWCSIKSFLSQGLEVYPVASSARTILLSFWLLALLTRIFWQADMTAHLTRKSNKLPINSLEELAAQDEIRPLLIKGTATYQMFKDPAAGEAHRRVYQKYVEQHSNVTSLSQAVKMILNNSKYAVIGGHHSLSYATAVHCLELDWVSDDGGNYHLGFAALPGQRYTEAVSLYLSKLKETGVIDRLRNKWWFTMNKCSVHETEYHSLGIQRSAGALIILTAFVALSLLSLLVEMAWNHLARTRKTAPECDQRSAVDEKGDYECQESEVE